MKKNIEDKKFDRTLLDKYFTVVLAGRPNVGKSTLFNALCSKRIAIEFSKPGTTRDPVEKTVRIDETDILLVDTGGFEFQSHDPLYIDVGLKAKFYIQNADLVLFMVEKDKIIDEDLAFLRYIKRYSRDYILVINKCEGKYPELFSKDIYQLGVPVMFPISAVHRENIGELEDFILNKANSSLKSKKIEIPDSIKLTIVGRPNTGKSTLLNSLLKYEKAIVSDIPGTTRDSIEATLELDDGTVFTIIDTAGIRKKSKVNEDLEYFSIKRSFAAIDESDIVIHLIEPESLVTAQDKKISDRIIQNGKGYILAVNKIDMISKNLQDSKPEKSRSISQYSHNEFKKLENIIDQQFPHINYVKKIFISAKEDINLDSLILYAKDLYYRIKSEYKTSQLNKILQSIEDKKPILIGNSFLNMLYMIEAHKVPRIFKIFTNKDPSQIPSYYQQYIINELREQLNLESIPVRIKFEKRKKEK